MIGRLVDDLVSGIWGTVVLFLTYAALDRIHHLRGWHAWLALYVAGAFFASAVKFTLNHLNFDSRWDDD